MTAIAIHTAALSFDADTRFDMETLGALMTKALIALDETGCTAPEPTLTGMCLSSTALHFKADIRVAPDAPQLVLSLSGVRLSAATVQAKLAGIVCHLATDLPVRMIDWLGTGTELSREAFLAALAPPFDTPAPEPSPAIVPRRRTAKNLRQPRPGLCDEARRPPLTQARTGRCAGVGAERLDAHVRAYNANLRDSLLRDADVAELTAMRKDLGLPSLEMRLSTWAVSLSIATISLPLAAPVMIYSLARGEDMRLASLSLGIAGFFLALDTTGAMAGALSSF